MRAFAGLFAALDRTTDISEKVVALEAYFREAEALDAAWALWFLAGHRLKRAVTAGQLRKWAAAEAGVPVWMVEECQKAVGDLAETLALLIPPTMSPCSPSLAEFVTSHLLPLADAPESKQHELVRGAWARLDTDQRFLWHRLMTGQLRVGVSRTLLARALARLASVSSAVMSYRLVREWQPTAEGFRSLISGEGIDDGPAQTYPFLLASSLEGDVSRLGPTCEWQCEWKWNGIRVQLIHRHGRVVLWSRGEEIVNGAFPEIAEAAAVLPEGSVLDGDVLVWRDPGPLSFARLQQRLNRKKAGSELRKKLPVVFMAYDLLEDRRMDQRKRPLSERRQALERLVEDASAAWLSRRGSSDSGSLIQGELFEPLVPPVPAVFPLRMSPVLSASDWETVAGFRQRARASGAEGLLLKRRSSSYGEGRGRGEWWKWKVAPFTCDAVLVAAQPGHGQRVKLYTDYTLAVWDGDRLVPVTRAFSGLTDDEIEAVDAFVRAHTTGRFGPVRSVEPQLVFELAFDGIVFSDRHKSGVALRLPRIIRWLTDALPAEADRLEMLVRLAESMEFMVRTDS